MASFSDTKITPANGQKLPAVDGFTTGYTETQELKAYMLNEKAQPNGLATLDSNGKLVSTQLPDFANDVLAFDSIASFPATGADGVLYIAKDENTLYRWDGNAYVSVSADTSELESRIITLENRTETVESDIIALEGTIDSIDTRLQYLETEVNTLETEVSTLEAENTQQAKDIAMLKYANEGKTYIIEESDRDGYSVDVKPSTVTGTAFGEAVLKSMEGRDVVVNQLAKEIVAGNYDNNGRNQVLSIGNGKISIHNNANYYDGLAFMTMSYTSGRKYFVSFKTTDSVASAKSFVSMTSAESPNPATEYASSTASGLGYHEAILVPNGNGTRIGFGTYSSSHGNADVTVEDISVVDLTLAFPTDTPTSLSDPRIADIKAYLAEHPEYNEGTIVNNSVTEVRSMGANLLNEATSKADTQIRYQDGAEQVQSGTYASDFISVEPNTKYTLDGITSSRIYRRAEYDADKAFCSDGASHTNATFTTGATTRYIRVSYYSEDRGSAMVTKGEGTTTYKPYKGTIGTLSLPSICSTLHGLPSARDKVSFVNDAEGKRILTRRFDPQVYTLDGSADENWALNTTFGKRFYLRPTPWNHAVRGYESNASVCTALCNWLTVTSAKTTENYPGYYRIVGFWEDGACVIRLEDYLQETAITTVEQFRAYLAQHPLQFVIGCEDQILDITDLVPEEPSLPIEDGGTLTFVNENRVATPSRISMPVKLGGTV